MLESLLEIKNAEDSAENIVAKAKSDMKKMLDDAENRKEEIFSSTKTKTADEIKKLKENYSKEAESEANKITLDGEKELDTLKKTAKVNFSKGVSAALSRVIE